MMEKPNLIYIDSLARGDKSVKDELIDVIKNEFPKEQNDYYESLKKKDFKKIEEHVHRLKHKISILGLEKSYKIANQYEHNLRESSSVKSEDFKHTLSVISNFLKTI
tara:strand:- start:23 stop:343 length:321 start_codon:yes stop_codon:yes gene_type:complete